jgi:hypothetical protein
MASKPTEPRYKGGGKTKFLVYRSPQPLRSGGTQERTRVKRVYFPASAKEISIDKVGEIKKRTGARVFGAAVAYETSLAPTRARRGRTTYKVPRRKVGRVKIIELPQNASNVRLTDRAPKGTLLAVA